MQPIAWFKRFYWEIKTIFEVNDEIYNEAQTINIYRIYWSAPALMFGSPLIAWFFYSRLNSSSPLETNWRLAIIAAHSVSALGSLIIWLFARRFRKNSSSVTSRSVLVYCVVAFVLALGLGIALIDQLAVASISALILATTMVGVLYYIRPPIAMFMFSTLALVFYLIFKFYSGLPREVMDANLTNGFLAIILGLVLSVLTWRNFYILKMQERKIKEQQITLEEMAYRDSLTQLPNRRLLDQLFVRELSLVEREQVQSSLIIFDLDNFKHVNDNYGHPIGDEVLRQLAQLLLDNLRPSSTLFRLGGEEFIILATHTSVDKANILAERLRRTIEEHVFLIHDHQIRITASFGVAPVQGVEENAYYYALADQALYGAKQAGKNQVVAYPF